MKSHKILVGAAVLAALMALAACSGNDEPEGKTETGEDDYYYADRASVSSSDTNFTPSSNGGVISFDAGGGTVVLNVDCGTEWTVDNRAADLLTTDVNLSAGTLTVSVGQNTVENEVSGSFYIITAGERVNFAYITVVQKAYGAPEISVWNSEWNFPALGALSTKITVDCSLGEFSAESNRDWLSCECSDTGVTLTVTENEVAEQRNATVTVKADDGVRIVSDYITVTQDARAYINTSTDILAFAKDASGGAVTVESNYGWNYSYDTSNGWFTVTRNDNSLTVEVAENDSDGREGTILLTAGDGAENVIESTVTVSQAGPSHTSLKLEYTLTNNNASVTLPLSGTVDCTVAWGDGYTEPVTNVRPSHTYESAGTYTVEIEGTVTALSMQDIASYRNVNTTLTSVVQWGMTGLTSMKDAFEYCTALSSIPADTMGSFAEVETFQEAFLNCSALPEIPEGLFDYAEKAESFQSTFKVCSLIKAIPAGLFDKCTAVTSFEDSFYKSSVAEIPADLFKYNTKVTSFATAFYTCPFSSIPEGLFDNCPEVTSFKALFECCEKLESVPADLFKYNTKVTSFYGTFFGCTSLTAVPESLFDNCPEVTDFTMLFDQCSALKEVPAGLFKNNSKVNLITYIFDKCTALEKIPAGLFSAFTEATSVMYSFRNCTALTEVPADLFDSLKNLTDVRYCFYGDTALTSESPYTVLEDGTKVHLYERQSHTDIFTKPSSTTYCFRNCTNMADYGDLPSSGWK